MFSKLGSALFYLLIVLKPAFYVGFFITKKLLTSIRFILFINLIEVNLKNSIFVYHKHNKFLQHVKIHITIYCAYTIF